MPAAWDQRHAFWDHEGALLEPALALRLVQAYLAQPVPARTPCMYAIDGSSAHFMLETRY